MGLFSGFFFNKKALQKAKGNGEKKKGYLFKSQTDTEVITVMLTDLLKSEDLIVSMNEIKVKNFNFGNLIAT